MRKLLLSFIFIFFLANISFAQQEVDKCFNYLDAGDYKRAIESGKRVVKLYPKNLAGYFCLSDAYKAIGDFNLAVAEMKKTEKIASSRGGPRKSDSRIRW